MIYEQQFVFSHETFQKSIAVRSQISRYNNQGLPLNLGDYLAAQIVWNLVCFAQSQPRRKQLLFLKAIVNNLHECHHYPPSEEAAASSHPPTSPPPPTYRYQIIPSLSSSRQDCRETPTAHCRHSGNPTRTPHECSECAPHKRRCSVVMTPSSWAPDLWSQSGIHTAALMVLFPQDRAVPIYRPTHRP